MAGYNYAEGMSNNACEAYGRGVKPLSRITKADLVEHEIGESLAFCKFLARIGWWKPCEWHHSGGTWYNEVDFFSVEDLSCDLETTDELAALKDRYNQERKAAKNEKKEKGVKVQGSYPIWHRTRRRTKIVGYVDFVGTLRGNWIFMKDGTKKNANGKHIEWTEVKRKKAA